MLAAALALTLASLVGWFWFRGNSSEKRTSIALALNWLFCQTTVSLTGNFTPSIAFLLADTLAASAILRHPAGQMQATVGAVYIFQILFHVIYMNVNNGYGAGFYLYILAVGAWIQVAALVIGTLYGGGGKKVGFFDRWQRRAGNFMAYVARRMGQTT